MEVRCSLGASLRDTCLSNERAERDASGIDVAVGGCHRRDFQCWLRDRLHERPGSASASLPLQSFHALPRGNVLVDGRGCVRDHGAVGVATFFDENSHLGLVSRSALALGLVGGTLLTLIVAFRLGAALDHRVGVESKLATRAAFRLVAHRR